MTRIEEEQMEEKKDKSYVIRDKRIFAETGDVRRNEETPTEAKPLETRSEPECQETEKEAPEFCKFCPVLEYYGYVSFRRFS
jgi:hypothetical protein